MVQPMRPGSLASFIPLWFKSLYFFPLIEPVPAWIGGVDVANTISASLKQGKGAAALNPSPLYPACHQKVPGVLNWSVSEFGTIALATTLLPALTAPVVQVLLVQTEQATVPVAAAVAL